MLAAVHHSADADSDNIAGFEAGDNAHDCRDMVMPRYAGVERSCSFGTDLMQVADAEIGDGDLDVMRPNRPAFDVDEFDWFVGGIGALGFDGPRCPCLPIYACCCRAVSRLVRVALGSWEIPRPFQWPMKA